ncbi:hypothetical protein [Secundilactobacillus muriivasis]
MDSHTEKISRSSSLQQLLRDEHKVVNAILDEMRATDVESLNVTLIFDDNV